MKLQAREPRVSRPKAREAIGTTEQVGLLEFDPRRDIPERNREKYKRQLGPGTGLSTMDLATYLTLFPDDQDELLPENAKDSQSQITDNTLGKALLFPGRIEKIKEQYPALDKLLDKFSSPDSIQMMKTFALMRLVYPVEAAKEQEFIQREWSYSKEDTEKTRRASPEAAILLAWMRLAIPERFSEIAPTTDQWRGMRAVLQEFLQEERHNSELKSLRLAFSLYILAAEEVAVVPGKGIVVTPRAIHLGQRTPMPDRLSA